MRPMGHIVHLRIQFKSINTYDYIITLIKRRKKNLLSLHVWEFIGSSFEETWIPIIHGCLCQVWLKLAQWFWRRGFFNFVNVFSLFRNYLPLEKGGVLHLNKLESPSPKDALGQVWLKFAQKKMKMWKVYRRTDRKTDRQTDDGRQLIRKAHLSFQLRWAKNAIMLQPSY